MQFCMKFFCKCILNQCLWTLYHSIVVNVSTILKKREDLDTCISSSQIVLWVSSSKSFHALWHSQVFAIEFSLIKGSILFQLKKSFRIQSSICKILIVNSLEAKLLIHFKHPLNMLTLKISCLIAYLI